MLGLAFQMVVWAMKAMVLMTVWFMAFMIWFGIAALALVFWIPAALTARSQHARTPRLKVQPFRAPRMRL